MRMAKREQHRQVSYFTDPRGDEYMVEPAERAGQTRVVKLTQDALDRYYKRGQLGDREDNDRRYDAGKRLRGLFYYAGLTPNVIAKYTDMISEGSIESYHAGRSDAYYEWQGAIQAVGPIASNEVITVCCLGEALNGRERLEILRRGLQVLVGHWRL